MSYVDEVMERVIAKNPSEKEFHQAVKEVLDSLRIVIEKNEENSVRTQYWSVLQSQKELFLSVFHG